MKVTEYTLCVSVCSLRYHQPLDRYGFLCSETFHRSIIILGECTSNFFLKLKLKVEDRSTLSPITPKAPRGLLGGFSAIINKK